MISISHPFKQQMYITYFLADCSENTDNYVITKTKEEAKYVIDDLLRRLISSNTERSIIDHTEFRNIETTEVKFNSWVKLGTNNPIMITRDMLLYLEWDLEDPEETYYVVPMTYNEIHCVGESRGSYYTSIKPSVHHGPKVIMID